MNCLPEDEDGPEMMQDEDCEVLMLREQIAMLTKQFYQDRQQWLEEKRRLQDTFKLQQGVLSLPSQQSDDPTQPGAARQQQRVSSGLLGSENGSEVVGEDASQGGISGRDRCSSFSSLCPSSRSASPGAPQTGSVSIASSAASAAGGPNSDVPTGLADMQRQLEESRRQQESASVRWALEREALQRQIHALISMSGAASSLDTVGSGGRGPAEERRDGAAGSSLMAHGSAAQEDEEERLQLAERVSELEALVEDLQAERDNLEEQIRVVAADATCARLATRGGATAADSAAPSPRPAAVDMAPAAPAPAAIHGSGDGDGGAAAAAAAGTAGAFHHGMTLRDSVNVAELLSEKAELERELRSLREECVAVPRAEYAELSSMRSQMAFLQTEVEALREEAEEAAQLRAVAEERDQMGREEDPEFVSVPHDEYQRLLRLDAEARGRGPATASAAATEEAAGEQQVQQQQAEEGLEEHPRRLTEALQERDTLAERVAALQQQLRDAAEAQLLATAAAGGGADTGAGADGSGGVAAAAEAKRREAVEAESQSEVAMLREQLAAAVAASVAESSRLGAQVSELQEELEALRSRNAALVAEASAVRHALESGQMKASDEARAAAAAAESARAAAAEELRTAQRRIAALEEELAEARKAAEAAWAEREQLSVEVAAVRDAALRTSAALADCLARRGEQPNAEGGEARGGGEEELSTAADAADADAVLCADAAADSASRVQVLEEQLTLTSEALARTADALADCQARREAAELAAAAAAAASAAAARELDAARLELAEARELGILFQSKRDAYQQSKRVMRGLPQEWIYGTGAAATAPPPLPAAPRPPLAGSAGSASGGAAAAERLTSFATSASTSTAGSAVCSTADEDLAAAASVAGVEGQPEIE